MKLRTTFAIESLTEIVAATPFRHCGGVLVGAGGCRDLVGCFSKGQCITYTTGWRAERGCSARKSRDSATKMIGRTVHRRSADLDLRFALDHLGNTIAGSKAGEDPYNGGTA